MSDELSPQWGKHTWWFALPHPSGAWSVFAGEAEIVDGVFHRLAFPGFETCSRGSFGISARFHVLDAIHRDEQGMYGPIRRIVLRNGRLISSEAVGTRERVIVPADAEESAGLLESARKSNGMPVQLRNSGNI